MSGTKPTPRHAALSQIAPLPPGTIPIPSNFVIPLTEYFPAAALPAFPVFTPASVVTVPLGTKKFTWWVRYTPGANGGFPRFRVIVGPGDPIYFGSGIVLDAASFNIANVPFGTTPFYMEELDGPPCNVADGTRVYCITLLNLPAACSQLALQTAEAGVPATPGNAHVAYTGEG